MKKEPDLCTIVGRNIRKAREAKEMTQSELAFRIHSTQSQIGKYERGEQDMSLSRLIKISEALNTPVVEFLSP